jgi:predicted nucleic acid-binding protein
MRADYNVVLDACVLLPMPLADTLLRMAENPRLYIPKWSDQIMNEVSRNLVAKFNKTEEQARRRETALLQAFPSAWVDSGYRELITAMPEEVDAKDRHVLAAAVRCNCDLIVTYNKKHFPQSALDKFSLSIKGPSAFLRDLYDLRPGVSTSEIDRPS